MAIEPGQRLLHYELAEKIGEGGMGVVWRARDTTLDRDVAIKFLAEAFSAEPERLARFEREAKLLATLNHTHIASVYGLHEADSSSGTTNFLVMELVPGEDLAARVGRGPMPLDEVLEVSRSIAEALEVAHESGVVHRDLKPANVRVTPDGGVKVLDFGLAKVFDADVASGSANPSMSPTLTSAGTAIGVILGTASYMSPEQARGRPVDRRADNWAFGCVLYELLTGRRAFEGETVSDTLAEVLKSEPDLEQLPDETPSRLRGLIERCLRKDPRRRLRDIGDARVELEEIIESPAEPLPTGAPADASQPPPRGMLRRLIPWLAAAGLLAVGLAAGYLARDATLETRVLRASILPRDDVVIDVNPGNPGVPTLSPDGRLIVFAGRGDDNVTRLYVQPLDSREARVLEGTDGAHYPFWSPDGRQIAYFEHADSALKKISVEGGPAVTVADAPNGKGGSWSESGDVIYAPTSNSGIHTVRETGGPAKRITTIDFDRGEDSHRHPFFLPDGRTFLYLARLGGESGSDNEIRLGSLDGEIDRALFRSDAGATYASGHILYLADNVLMAWRFDPDSLEFGGNATPLIDAVYLVRGAARGGFSASRGGTLTYLDDVEEPDTQLVWRAADGKLEGPFGDEAFHRSIRASPDGSQVLVVITDPGSGENDVWLYDVARETRSRFSFESGSEQGLAWSPDGSRAYYTSISEGNYRILARSVDGADDVEQVFESTTPVIVQDVSPDGRFLFVDAVPEDGSWDCMRISLADGVAQRTLEPVVQSEWVDVDCAASPDGQWIAYESMEGGLTQVFVRPFDSTGRKWQISSESGANPFWSRDGRQLFYTDVRNTIHSVAVESSDGRFIAGTPEPLFDTSVVTYDKSLAATPDGRFLSIELVGGPKRHAVNLVVGWDSLVD
jgi:Tol biopolymer transport system component